MIELETKGDRVNCLERWKRQDYMEKRKRERDNIIKEWLITSNVWDRIKNQNEAFEIEDIRGFKQIGCLGFYLVYMNLEN